MQSLLVLHLLFSFEFALDKWKICSFLNRISLWKIVDSDFYFVKPNYLKIFHAEKMAPKCVSLSITWQHENETKKSAQTSFNFPPFRKISRVTCSRKETRQDINILPAGSSPGLKRSQNCNPQGPGHRKSESGKLQLQISCGFLGQDAELLPVTLQLTLSRFEPGWCWFWCWLVKINIFISSSGARFFTVLSHCFWFGRNVFFFVAQSNVSSQNTV